PTEHAAAALSAHRIPGDVAAAVARPPKGVGEAGLRVGYERHPAEAIGEQLEAIADERDERHHAELHVVGLAAHAHAGHGMGDEGPGLVAKERHLGAHTER